MKDQPSGRRRTRAFRGLTNRIVTRPLHADGIRLIALAALTTVVAACSPRPDWGSVETIAGEQVRVECRGTATPAVVLVHGIGDEASSASYEKVLERLPTDRRVCRYDRPGAGDSPEPRRQGRDAENLDQELDGVVQRADPNRPVLLVGHSFGSYPVLTYTTRHRERVAAVVLLDGVEPTMGLLQAIGVSDWSDVKMAAERLDLAAVQEQTASAVSAGTGALADLPLTVVRRDKGVTPDWLAAQQRLAALSGKGRLVVAAGSGHEVPTDAPDSVVTAIG
jgi:pimeloyl-ACP methyl ester carboxylesterase